MKRVGIIMLASLLLLETVLMLMPVTTKALFPWDGGANVSNCPPSCTSPNKIWISISCQQRKLIDGPRAAGCCFYCAAEPNSSSDTSSSAVRNLDVDKFDTKLDLTSAQGIATLISTGLQLFLGAAAIYTVYIAIKSAIMLANPANKETFVSSSKKLVSALIGLVICGAGLLFLQLASTWLGLGNIDQVFRTIAPVIEQGSSTR